MATTLHYVNWLKPEERPRSSVTFSKPSMTKQQFAEDCDINVLVSRFHQTGMFYDPMTRWQNAGLRVPTFEDVSEFPADLLEVNAKMKHFEDLFAQLPAKTREMFGGNYLHFIAFMQDEKNTATAVKMGLVKPADKPVVKAQEPAPAPAATPAPAPAPAATPAT